MDPIQIIIVVGIIIGALIILYFALALIMFLIGSRKMKTFMQDEDDFFKSSHRRF